MNYKKECLMLAKKQFIIDIQKDIDFIEFKKNCYKGNSINYGCIVVSDSSWLLNCGISSQTIISKYYKEILHT
jgi:hypothetical protein